MQYTNQIRFRRWHRGLLMLGSSSLILLSGCLRVAQALPPVPDSGQPTWPGGAGDRGCGDPMLAMAPTFWQEKEDKSVTEGYTSQEAPEIWVNVPYEPGKELKELELVVRDSQGEKFYERSVVLPQTAGLLKIQLPELNNRERYRWSLKALVDCEQLGGAQRKPIRIAKAWIERYQPNENESEDKAFMANINQASELEQVELYHQAGYWYDALNLLARLRQDSPDNAQVEARWKAFLSEYHLCSVAEQSFAEPSSESLI